MVSLCVLVVLISAVRLPSVCIHFSSRKSLVFRALFVPVLCYFYVAFAMILFMLLFSSDITCPLYSNLAVIFEPFTKALQGLNISYNASALPSDCHHHFSSFGFNISQQLVFSR